MLSSKAEPTCGVRCLYASRLVAVRAKLPYGFAVSCRVMATCHFPVPIPSAPPLRPFIPMAKRTETDLFAESTMSFGDHLEELRICLSKSLIGLIVGFLIGLCVANMVVSYIQTPLKQALENYYIAKAISDLETEYQDRGEDVSEGMRTFISEHRYISEKVEVEASEVARVGRLAEEYQASRSEPDSSATAGGSSDDAPAPASDGEAEDGEAADDGAAAEDGEARWLGGDPPMPRPVMISTRVWKPINTVVKALNAQEVFMIWIKAAFVTGLVIASPWIFYQIWLFVAAGLYPHEKKYVYIYLPFSLILFLAGAAIAFFLVFQYVLKFLFGFNQAMNIDPDPRISEWLSFVLVLPLGFGIAFQLPLVMLFLHRIGIFSLKAYVDKWRIAVLVIFVISMLLTPADPMSMLLMAVPLCALYFLGIAMCRWMPRNRNPFPEGYEP